MSLFSTSLISKLLASDAAGNDAFGVSVAISSDGNTAIIGAYTEDTSPNTNNGAAYVFTRSAGVWSEQQKLTASDAASSDFFGYSVALSSDGNTALIGAYEEDTSPNTTNGAVYVFTRSGSTWTQQQKLLASDAASNDTFGFSVSISADGLTAIIGADSEDTSPNTNNGAAYVFTLSAGVWSEQQKLTASDAAGSEFFGRSVSISSDGNTAVIGAYLEDTSPNTNNGAAYVFTRSGSTWTQQQKLTASDAATNDYFGVSVSISADGNTAIVGAYIEDTSPNTDNGAAYVFTRTAGTWTQQQKLLASDAATDDRFGGEVALSADGNTALIGANGESTSPNTTNGAVYVFTRSGSTWTQQQKLLASDPASGDSFGGEVSISADGLTAIIGADSEDTSPNTNNGAAYIYNLEQTPSAPSITSTSHGDTEVTLTFNAPVSYPEWVTNYEYSIDDGATFTALSPADATSPVTITGLTNNVAYIASLRAINSSGTAGDASAGIVVKPGVPTGPTITSIDRGANYLDVNFDTPSSTGGYAISNYAYSYTSATVVVSSATVSSNIATITTSTNHGVVAGYEATLFNLTANSGSVEYLVLSAPTSTTFTIAYTASNGPLALGSTPTSTSKAWVAFDPTDTTTPVRITGLTAETQYLVSIRAINSVGSGLTSNEVAGTPSETPSAPTITSITPSNETLTVNFTAPSYTVDNTIINYQYSLDGSTTWESLDPADTTSPISITGLANGVSYSVTIRAVAPNAFGETSNAVEAIPATVPSAPSIFSIGPSNNALIISVTPPLDNGGSPIIYYQYSLDGGITYSIGFDTNTILATGLTNGTSYSVTVRAVNALGAGPASSAVLATPADRDYVLSVLNKGLTPIHAEQDRYNFAPKLAGDIRILLEDQANYLTFNTIDSSGLVWVISDIEGWWNLPEPSIPDIERGFGDGSFDVAGRNIARVITITGSVLVTESSRGGIATASASARQQLLSAFNLVRRGTWLIVDEDSRKRASFVRLSGRPNISTVSNRGRIEFSIGLKAADPIKYEWIEGTADNVPVGTEAIANGYNVKTIGEFGYSQTINEMYDKYGNVDYTPSTTENYREYDDGFGRYGEYDTGSTAYVSEDFREYASTTQQTGVSSSTTVTNYGTSNVYCYFRVVGPLFGPAEILNTTTGQALGILAPSVASGTNQVLTPDETSNLVEYLDIDTRNREVHIGSFQNGQSSASSRGLIDPVVDWIYLAPGDNTISFTDYGTDVPTSAPQLQIYWRSGWSG